MIKTIITEQDIINTYKSEQQEQCRLYYAYQETKSKNPEWGYKRIAKSLNQPLHKTRWWHANKHIPTPIQTAQWLKDRNLLPFTLENPQIKLIARILGTTYGDGGIFENLNAIFLSSSELEAVKEFGEDLKKIFGNEIEINSRIIEGGEYGHSWCYQNTNRNIIRLFNALGAPLGRKTKKELFIPEWVFEDEEIADEFFGSFMGNEIGIPKIHIEGNKLDTCMLGICGTPSLEMNRYKFLNDFRKYLDLKGINTGKIVQSYNKKDQNTIIFKILLATNFENMLNLYTLTKIYYCKSKQDKLLKTLNQFAEIKLQKYNQLIKQGYNKRQALQLLKISRTMLFIIKDEFPLENLTETSINFTSKPINCEA